MKSSIRIVKDLVSHMVDNGYDITLSYNDEDCSIETPSRSVFSIVHDEDEGLEINVHLSDCGRDIYQTFYSVMSFEAWFVRVFHQILDGDMTVFN